VSVETLRPLGVGPPLPGLACRPTEENRAQDAAPAALVSIVLPTFGQLEMTRLQVDGRIAGVTSGPAGQQMGESSPADVAAAVYNHT
jgi:hypothetical protein